MAVANSPRVGVRRVDELVAYQLTVQFKLAVYDLVRTHPVANRDLPYRTQLFDAASSGEANIVEGFGRFGAREFRRFLGYARASIAEAMVRVTDGQHRGYFSDPKSITNTIELGNRATGAIVALHQSLWRFTKPPRHTRRRDTTKSPRPKKT